MISPVPLALPNATEFLSCRFPKLMETERKLPMRKFSTQLQKISILVNETLQSTCGAHCR